MNANNHHLHKPRRPRSQKAAVRAARTPKSTAGRYRLMAGALVALLALTGPAVAQDDAGSASESNTKLSAQIFVNASNRDTTRLPADSSKGVDLRRLFLNLDHSFGERWSAHFTSEVNRLRHESPTDVWLLHAYAEYRRSPALTLRAGSAPLPWVGLSNAWSGYRYVDKDLLTDRQLGGPSDWGAHATGRSGQLEWAASAVTGSGFQRPKAGSSVNFEGSLGWLPAEHTIVAVGGYRGKRARSGQSPTSTRWTAMLAHRNRHGRAGIQGVRATDWQQVSAGRSTASGWSVWGSVNTSEKTAIFARHDHLKRRIAHVNASIESLAQLGLEWIPSKNLRLAFTGKRRGIGPDGNRVSANEVGVWADLRLF